MLWMIRNFAEAREALRVFYNQSGSNTYTLDRMRALMAYLGNLQDRLKIVHVAGTSGKTSTAYYVSALLEASGANVGLTVGPHIDAVNERVQINHTPLPEHEFCSALDDFLGVVAASDIKPSYFELLVAFAFWQFALREVDYAVVEVGLGGLLDGTNVISREDKVCVITDIGLDHTNILGNTLGEIAAQKAGIIHAYNHVFMYEQPDEVMDVVAAACKRENAMLHKLTPGKQESASAHLPLFQQRNFYLAEQAAQYVLDRDGHPKLKPSQIKHAAEVHIPGRMEVYHTHGKTIILDGAHNEQKMAAFAQSVHAAFPGQPIATLAAFVGTKTERWQAPLSILSAMAEHIIVTSFEVESGKLTSKEAVDPKELHDYLQSGKVSLEPDLTAACRELLARPEPLLLITGSLYMLHDAREQILRQQTTKSTIAKY
jgi:dihydrofolate synthase / folylpolyglutamate synthase